MKTNRFRTALLFSLLTGAVFAVAQQSFEFTDKKDKLKITNPGGSFKATRDAKDPDRIRVRMTAAGNGLITAVSETQGLTMKSPVFSAVTHLVGKTTEIETANLSGGVTATILRPSSKKGSTVKQTILLTADILDYFGKANRAELKGGITIDQKDPAAEMTMTGKGNSGEVVLTDAADKNEKGPVQSAVLTGNARITLTSVRMVTERPAGKPAIRVKQPFNIILTGDRVTFQLAKGGDDYGTITVTGNVVVTGNDPLLFGNMTGVDKLTIKLDSEMKPYQIASDGNPAVTKLTEKSGG